MTPEQQMAHLLEVAASGRTPTPEDHEMLKQWQATVSLKPRKPTPAEERDRRVRAVVKDLRTYHHYEAAKEMEALLKTVQELERRMGGGVTEVPPGKDDK